MTVQNLKLSLIGISLVLFSACVSPDGAQIQNNENNASMNLNANADTGTPTALETDLPLDSIKLPEGFFISLFAKDVAGARSLALGKNGTVFVGTKDEGVVYALEDANHDGIAEKKTVIARKLNQPNGVAYKDGTLYVAEISRVIKFENIDENIKENASFSVVNDSYASDTYHGWKFIAIGPDNKLYIPVGAPCNVCDRGEAYANITRMNLDGSAKEIFAIGIRNTVGFDWKPGTNDLWFTDNGRDLLGDTLPPDELNRAEKAGLNFGFPFCHGGDLLDKDYGQGKNCNEYIAPVQKLGAHMAALGMRFYTGMMFPENYKNQVFIAQHGSWNSSVKVGYKLSLVKLENNKATSYEDFATGWIKDDKVWGRPVDLQIMPDGSMLVSDDYAGVVYRITYRK